MKSPAQGYLVYKKRLYLAKVVILSGCHGVQAALAFGAELTCAADVFGSFWGLAEGALEGGSQD